MAAKKKSSPTFEFTKKLLERKPAATFAEVQAAAQKKGLKVIPVVYGRAKRLLGLVDPKKRKATAKKAAARKKLARKSAARAKGSRKTTTRRRAGLQGDALTSLEVAIRTMRSHDAERERMRRALERIRSILDDVLS